MNDRPGKQVRNLAFCKPFQNLAERGKTFDLMQALGVTSREAVYSNALAFLFDPEAAHSLGARPLVRFLRAAEAASDRDVLPFASLLGSDLGRVRVLREHRGIDVLIELTDRRTVVAIENKVFAGEQKNQVARYQAQLERDYPSRDWRTCLVFLTPFGVAPETENKESPVPIVLLDYRLVASLLRDAVAIDRQTDSTRFVQGLADHITHEILGDHPMEKEIWALWSDPAHARAMAEAVRHCPDLMSVKDLYLERVRKWAASELGLTIVDESLYPTKGTPCELAFYVREWQALGLPVLIKFYWHADPAHWEEPDRQAAIRALVWWEDFKAANAAFEAVQARQPEVVSADFAPVKNWNRNYHRFLKEDDYPVEAVVSFTDEGFVDKLVHRTQYVIQQVDAAIRPDKEQTETANENV